VAGSCQEPLGQNRVAVPCMFCGNPKLSREHVYRRGWIKSLIPGAESHTHRLAGGQGEPLPVSTWTSPEADLVVRCVCADCNNGWMNDLDHAAEAILNAMCQGEQKVRVVDGALLVFASWAVKMAFLFDCLFTPLTLRQEDRDFFYRSGIPPDGFVVWVATMESYEEETRSTPMTLVSSSDLGGIEQAFLATFRVLHLVIQVLAPIHPHTRPERQPDAPQHVEQAWPRTEPLEWPLPRGHWLRSEEDFLSLSRIFRSDLIVRPAEPK
jgi:hypothetical protein